MVKQFTIPCQFQQSTSPVTLYIGHPEFTHHPVHFQSDWLSSTKGGTIPQDLMDTLQRLHDLANQNGADFEELCYYALISATQHSVGTGVSKEDINKYAQEYVQSDGQVAQQITEANKETNNDANNNNTTQPQATEGQTEQKTNKAEPATKQEPQAQNEEQPYKKIAPSIQQPAEDTKNKQEEKPATNDEDSLIGDTRTISAQETQHNQDVLEQLGKIDDNKNNTNNADNKNIGTINMSSTPTVTTSAKSTAGEAVYTQEDEDLLLEDDMTTMQDEAKAKEAEKLITDTMNEILARQEKREAEEKAKSASNDTGNTTDIDTSTSTADFDNNNANNNNNLANDTTSITADNTNPTTESNTSSSVYSSDDDDLLG